MFRTNETEPAWSLFQGKSVVPTCAKTQKSNEMRERETHRNVDKSVNTQDGPTTTTSKETQNNMHDTNPELRGSYSRIGAPWERNRVKHRNDTQNQ